MCYRWTYTKTFAGEKGTKHADQRDSVASSTSTSTSTLLTDKTLQHHISIKFISINYKYKKYNIIFQGDKI